MKPKKITSFQNLNKDLKKLLILTYPDGYENHIIEFKDYRDNKIYKAISLETDENYYLVLLKKEVNNSTAHVEENENDENYFMDNYSEDEESFEEDE